MRIAFIHYILIYQRMIVEGRGTKGSISFEANLMVLVLEALTSW